MAIAAGILVLVYGAYAAVVEFNQRSLLYFPSHHENETGLGPWIVGGRVMGYCHQVPHPRTVWLMAHGNGGQANQRTYVLGHIGPDDSLFVVEYPGYGIRPGKPSMDSMNAAAAEAYQDLRREFPSTPVCALGESIGSGPASFLCTLPAPPDKLVLIVPFDDLASVASEHMPLLPVGLLLKDRWNNIDALRGYKGPVVIYGAVDDQIIPVRHARNLASKTPGSVYVQIAGGHNDWSANDAVRIER